MVREGSRRFDALELHRTSAKSPCTSCFSSKYVDRGGSVESNQLEPMLKRTLKYVDRDTPYLLMCNDIQPAHSTVIPRTFLNHIISDIAKCVELFNIGLGWFDCTEPPLSTYLEAKQGVQGAFALVRCSSSASNLLEPSRTTSLQI